LERSSASGTEIGTGNGHKGIVREWEGRTGA
jgi:hypothetical protein